MATSTTTIIATNDIDVQSSYPQSNDVPKPTFARLAPLTEPAQQRLSPQSSRAHGAQIDEPTSPTTPATAVRAFPSTRSTARIRPHSLLLTALIITANLVQMISNMCTIAAGLTIAPTLGLSKDSSSATWLAAAYSLTQGSVVLVSGRLGAVYGHKNMLLVGGAVFTVGSLVTGFCDSYVPFTSLRALTGVGGGVILPNAVALLSITTPPGRVRNVGTALFAASAPIGGWLGALLVAVVPYWNWAFWILAMAGAVVFGLLTYLVPYDQPVDKGGRIDVTGAALGVSGLVLFNFVWNQAPSVGWNTPYEISLLLVAILLFGSFITWEKYGAVEPIMPLSIFKTQSFSALILVVLLTYMSFSISLWYMIAWQQLERHWTLLQLALGWIPFGVGATLSAGLAAWLIPRLSAQWIVAIGCATAGAANLLLATMPVQQRYWKQVFPGIALGSFCPDLVYTAAQIIASNGVNRRNQGIAASLIGTLNLYGNSLGLGFAGTIETHVARGGGREKGEMTTGERVNGYRAALWFGVGIAVLAMGLDVWLVRMPRDVDTAGTVLVSTSVARGMERSVTARGG